MGSRELHLRLACERIRWIKRTREAGDYSVMAELCYKACEQAVQADLASIPPSGIHYRRHEDIIAYVRRSYPRDIAERFSDLYRLYISLGYEGSVPSGIPERAYNHAKTILDYLGRKLDANLLEELEG